MIPLLALLPFFAAVPAAPPHAPNVVILLADDIGYGEVSCYGERRYQTPNIDALARGGLRFTDFYAGAPECAPSRCCLMTGRDPGHSRIRANFSYDGSGNGKRIGLQADDRTLPELLRARGYATACIGKWGLGEDGTPGAPWNQGFDTFFGFVNQTHAHNYFPEFIYRGQEKEPLPGNFGFADKTYVDDLFMTEALGWLDRQKNAKRPFFLYLALTLPHGRLTAPDDADLRQEPLDLSDGYPADRVKPTSHVFAGMVRRFDRDVGRVMAKLRELGIEQDTLVLFTSDNGPAHVGPTEDDTIDVDFFQGSGGLRGEKSDVYEGGIRVPAIAYWPGRIAPGQVSDAALAFWDILPTCAELAGGPAPAAIEGESFVPALFGRPQAPHRYLYWEFISKGQPRIALREGPWKVDRYGLQGPWQLYDLDSDPGERHDVASEHPAIAARLAALARQAHVDNPDFPLRERRPKS